MPCRFLDPLLATQKDEESSVEWWTSVSECAVPKRVEVPKHVGHQARYSTYEGL